MIKIQTLTKPSIKLIEKYIPGESNSRNNKNIIKLSSNESPFKIPNRVYSGVTNIVAKSNFYPDGDSKILKDSISKIFKLNVNKIICGNGSDDILSIISQTFSKENCEVICSEFGFTYYPIIARASGCKVVFAPTENLSISCNNILKKINKKTKIIFFANPNNPTGTIIFKDELINFLNKVPTNVIVVLDGAYSEFITDKRYSDGIDLVDKYPNLIITRTFSKIFALAGLRLGWGYSNTETIELLEKIRGPFNVNSIAQHIGSLILKEKDFLIKSIMHNERWRKSLPMKVNELGLESYETFANFILIKVNPLKYSKKEIINYLKNKNILVRDLQNYKLNNYFRVSIGSTVNLNKFLKELKNALKLK
tara:strand:+ start:104 stop:1201 length:1098 start_codon:yes stop_codon:yes gene_type:complete